MTIRQSTSISVDLTTNLLTDNGNGTTTKTKAITNNLLLPVGGYTMGSIDILDIDGTIQISRSGAAIITSTDPINVTVDATTLSDTKLFAYDGPEVPISISTNSTSIVTVEYIMGHKPIVLPSAPIITEVVPGDTSAMIYFTEPNDGGSPITRYTITTSPGGITAFGPASPLEVSNLTNGTPYTFTMVATNRIGTSLPSAPSLPITPNVQGNVPDAPTIYDISMNGNNVTVYFDIPVNDGGQPITQYLVSADVPGFFAYGTESPITVSGLDYGTTYTFTVQAENAIGLSLPSNVSASETPMTVPTAPSITNITPNADTVTIEFNVPWSDGGSPITEYIAKSLPDYIEASGTESPITISGLQYGIEYVFVVRARNAVGDSFDSDASAPITLVAP